MSFEGRAARCAADLIGGMREREESRVTPDTFTQATGRTELPFTDLENTVGEASVWSNGQTGLPACLLVYCPSEASEVFLRHKSELHISSVLWFKLSG